MITSGNELVALRKEHGRFYQLEFGNLPFVGSVTFIFRALKLNEYKHYKQIIPGLPSYDVPLIYEELVDLCLIDYSVAGSMADYPDDYLEQIVGPNGPEQELSPFDLLPAGVWPTLANAILHQSFPSGWEEFNNRVNQTRIAVMSDDFQRAAVFVMAVFGYKPEDVDNMSFDVFAERIAQAELAVSTQPDLPITANPPEDPAKSKKRYGLKDKDMAIDNSAIQRVMGSTIAQQVDANPEDFIQASQEHVDKMHQLRDQRMAKILNR